VIPPPDTAIVDADSADEQQDEGVTPASHEEPAKEAEPDPPEKETDQNSGKEEAGKASVELTPTD
jgi:hypothetical protein